MSPSDGGHSYRNVAAIARDICDGCGECAKSCTEGALAVVNGKAQLVDEACCDGLGMCLGACPVNAVTMRRMWAKDYDKEAVVRRRRGVGIYEG